MLFRNVPTYSYFVLNQSINKCNISHLYNLFKIVMCLNY
ncbi:unnamed protein product [Tenebrio molitor]|nr:unnamed protein product [Tenebrio molitor]